MHCYVNDGKSAIGKRPQPLQSTVSFDDIKNADPAAVEKGKLRIHWGCLSPDSTRKGRKHTGMLRSEQGQARLCFMSLLSLFPPPLVWKGKVVRFFKKINLLTGRTWPKIDLRTKGIYTISELSWRQIRSFLPWVTNHPKFENASGRHITAFYSWDIGPRGR